MANPLHAPSVPTAAELIGEEYDAEYAARDQYRWFTIQARTLVKSLRFRDVSAQERSSSLDAPFDANTAKIINGVNPDLW